MPTMHQIHVPVDRHRLASRRPGIACRPGYDQQEPFAEAFLAADGDLVPLRIARGFAAAWDAAPVPLGSSERVLGVPLPQRVTGLQPICGKVHAENPARFPVSPERQGPVSALVQAMQPYVTWTRIVAAKTAAGVDLDPAIGSGPSYQGHMLADFASVLTTGIDGFAARLARARTVGSDDPQRVVFHQCAELMIGLWRRMLERLAAAAEAQAGQVGAARGAELVAMAAACRAVNGPPPQSLAEAVQLYWLTFLLDGNDDAGRLDHLLWPFLRDDLVAGRLDPDAASELLADLFFKLESVTAWGLVLGGSDAAGQDQANPLTWFFLELAEAFPQTHPAISLRVHRGTPADLLDQAFRTLGAGAGMPALLNDEAIVAALVRSGVTPVDACDYGVGGCIEYQVAGKACVGGEDGQINLAKCLELALNDGICTQSGRRLGPATGDPSAWRSFTEVQAAYSAQVEAAADRIVAGCTLSQRIKSQDGTKPMRSLLIADCIERGRDCEGGGARYGHGQILTMGLVVVADSLAVLKHLVFGDGRVALAELLSALRENWQGHEGLRQRIGTHAPRCGNGDARADDLAAWAAQHLWDRIGKVETNRGGHYHGLVVYFTRAHDFGRSTGATPDGRRAGDVLEDSIGPYPGRDRLGPTAVMHSATSVPQELASGGVILNLRLDQSAVQTATGRQTAAALVRGYFDLGGQHVQITTASTADLEAAMREPDRWQHLIVRVGGFSARFTGLAPELQRTIIARTIHLAAGS